LREPIDRAAAVRTIREGIDQREKRFLTMLARGVYGDARSPFRQLLLAAGVEYGDAAALVGERGVEGTLESLYELGVYLTYEEAKGTRAVERAGIDRRLAPADLENPLSGSGPRVATVGSSGRIRRAALNLADFEHAAAYTSVFSAAFGLDERPSVLWRPTPPGRAGLSHLLQLAKLGRTVDAWYTQNDLDRATAKERALLRYTLSVVGRAGFAAPEPQHVPPERADVIAGRLASHVRAGGPAEVNAPASAAVRVCLAAAERGLDVSGTFFRVGGEPFTPAKAAVFDGAGCRAVCHYTMSEIGRIGNGCASGRGLDDVHVSLDQFAVIQPELRRGPGGALVRPLYHSTVTLSSRTLVLNLESGDYGEVEERECNCLLGRLGLSVHLHSIRSYEKLTSEGMNFLHSDLLRLIEETLPARFGGGPTDYQLVEDEEDGLPKVAVVIAPGVGPVDDSEVVRTVLEGLAAGASHKRMMAGIWHDARTVHVLRRAPYATAAGKVQPLHVLAPRAQAQAASR
jgi:hypothetical protein